MAFRFKPILCVPISMPRPDQDAAFARWAAGAQRHVIRYDGVVSGMHQWTAKAV